MVNFVIKDFIGQAYELTGRASSPRSSSAQRYSSDAYSTFRLVANLPLAPAHWVQLLRSTDQYLPDFHSSHPGEVYQAVAAAIMRGDLMLYKLPALNANHCLAGKKGVGLGIIKGPNPHCATDLIPEVIGSVEAAQQLLDNLGISPQALLGYLSYENLYNSYQKRNPLNDALQLLASGDLLAYKILLPPKSPPKKATEYLPATAADRPVPLAPENNNFSTSNNAKNSEKFNATPSEMVVRSANSHSELVYEKPTAEDIALAKSEGSSSLHIQARETVARDFLKNNGFTQDQIEDALGAPDGSKNGGIDLSKPVEVITFPPPEKMVQYVKSHGYPGNWFDPLSTQTPEMLGISGETRTLKSFTVVPGSGLKSIAKPVVDNWTNPENPIATSGGGIQLLVNDETKSMISSINPIGV